MTTRATPQGPDEVADLTTCDREPIHVPGSIQPHGALLAMTEAELTVVQASENVRAFVGVEVDRLRNAPLALVLGERGVETLRERHLAAPSPPDSDPLSVEIATADGRRRYDALVHRSADLLVLELEPAPPREEGYADAFVRRSRQSLARLHDASSTGELLDRVAREVRTVTGFDRVMVYRFDADWHGEVVAEARAEDVESFLGLHYPASDIPAQARALYARSWLRLIPDARYVPVPLVPRENPLTGAPLDLSGAVLRSVSPVHCEYLRNMGVVASMSISLLRDGKLWGLVACHHRTPRVVPYEVRAVCEFLGRLLSWQLSTQVDAEEAARRARSKAAQTRFLQAMSTDVSLPAALFRAERELLAFVGATGVALCQEGAVQTAGATPIVPWVQDLVRWLGAERREDVFHTDHLAGTYPPAAQYGDVASGLLAVCISREGNAWLLWFRPEVLRTVTWGGDPAKPARAERDGARLSPRRSFAAWQELVRNHAAPWDETDLEAARDLRVSVLAVLVRRAAELKKLNEDLRSALRARDDFVSVAAHELRTPISTLSMQVHNLVRAAEGDPRDRDDRQRLRLEIAGRQVKRLEQLVEVLLDAARIRAGRLHLELADGVPLDDVLGAAAARAAPELERAGTPLVRAGVQGIRGRWDPLRVEQIAANLLSNAAKYGAGRPVTLTTGLAGDRAWFSVRDEGIGIAPDALARIFERFERAVSERDYAGLGLGLWFSRQLAAQLGGEIAVASEPGRGATFTVTLPLAGPPAGPAPGGAP